MLFHTIVLFHKSSLYKKQLTGGVLLIRSSKEICKSFKKIPAPVSFLIKFQAAFLKFYLKRDSDRGVFL